VTYKEFNAFCGSLPVTNHVVQWGNSHVWKVDSKVFAIGGWQEGNTPAIVFKVSDIAYEVLKDMPGLRPAPYFASRGMKWIQHFGTPGLSDEELKRHIQYSYEMVSKKLTKKRQKELGLNQEDAASSP
jgi:predicted DNA-binding protein (MmcQ/YjbR family)